MKTTTFTFLASLAVAAGFAPTNFAGRRATPLYMSDELKQGAVKWYELNSVLIASIIVDEIGFSYYKFRPLTTNRLLSSMPP